MNTKPKILIVDDKPENLKALEIALKGLDVEVIKATNGNDALKATLNHDFALALLDVQMPEMDGYELAEILKEEEKTSRVPIIFLSAVYTDSYHVFRGYEVGAFSFITKPFKPKALINKVSFFMEKQQYEHAFKKDLYNKLEAKNEELQAINKELEAFSYSVSHDLRAPLRAINGYSQVLIKKHGDKIDQEGNRLINVIKSNAIKMGMLIDDLLAFSKLGKNIIQMDKVDMDELTNQVLEELNDSIVQNKTKVKRLNKLPEIMGDYNLLKQVMFNLLSNAIKYSSKKNAPIVEIASNETENQGIVFSVKDNGAGFNMNYYDKLFDVFHRLHTDEEFEGTGIGLAIVQKIIAKHGGRVWAKGEIDNGAIFYFSLLKA